MDEREAVNRWARESGDRLLIERLTEERDEARARVAAFEEALSGFAHELRAGGNIGSAYESMEGRDWDALADLFLDRGSPAG